MLNVLMKGRFQNSVYRFRYLWAALSVMLGSAVYGYMVREKIVEIYSSVEHSIVSVAGLGVVVILTWSAVFIWAILKRRTLFARYNLWLGSLAAVIFTLGFLALFQPYDGKLAFFALDGDGSLGGYVGETILGSDRFLGILRLFGIFLLTVSLSAPKLTRYIAVLLGKLSVFTYVLLFTGVKKMMSALGRMYQSDRKSAPVPILQADKFEVPNITIESLENRRRSRDSVDVPQSDNVYEAGEITDELLRGGDDDVIEQVIKTHGNDQPESHVGNVTWIEPSVGTTLGSPTQNDGGHLATLRRKVNKFWDAAADKAEESDTSNYEFNALSEKESESPIVDPSEGSWDQPPLDILFDTPEGGISQDQIDDTAKKIKNTLADYSVEVEIGQVRPGPTVTMYGLIPGWVRRYKKIKVTDDSGQPKKDESGKPVYTNTESKVRVKVDSITSREKDLALAMKTPSLRIETPAMGEALVGIEVPNPNPNLVALRGVMESDEFRALRDRAELPIALGKGSGGDTVVLDLAQMPHLLVAGSTGSGKSVCLNTIISCLIMGKTPDELRLMLVDPKRVELTPYNGIPHLLTPVVVETDQVVALLKGMIREMLNRYRRFEEVSVRNIQGFNNKTLEKMPYLVVVVDELADLMMSASFDVEQSLCRLAQLGRATGIHLVVATQRPSVDVVTGLIKANFPSRVSFGVTSQIDSRTILDTAGAEKLLGKGDMLYLPSDGARPERVQGVFISDAEIDDLVRWWHSTTWAPLPAVSLHTIGEDGVMGDESDGSGMLEPRDEMLASAIDLAQRYSKLSTSLLQRRLRIGYPRAARLMDDLEEQGVVGPSDGSKSRDVIMSQVQ